MDDRRLSRIEDKLDKVHDSISRIDVTLAAQHASLAEHIKRTNILEAEIRPIKNHVSLIQAVIKVVTAASAGVGLAVAIKALFG